MGYLSCNAESAIATCDPYNWDRRKKHTHRYKADKPLKIRDFAYSELQSATNGFSAESFLGKGSHGSVYKAVLDDGKLVAAVKKTTFQTNSSRNNCNNTPAENEIEILSRIRNPRLVNLLGFGVDSNDAKLIVVEFMPNGSLYDLIHSSSRAPGWTRRVRFMLQIAKGIESLHSSNPPVIHRDIKSSNILLDNRWNARLGDFGLSLRGHVEDVRVKCTPPAGTLGYLDPSYLSPGDLSTKSDVFSFGILLLEVVSGRNAIDVNFSPPSVVDWAVPLIKRGEFVGMCDPSIGPPADPAVIRQLAVLAARCVRTASKKRPTMAEVVDCLRVINKLVHAPVWNNLRRRVRRVKKQSLLKTGDAFDGVAEMVKTQKLGSRRNSKVSSVPITDYKIESLGTGGDRVARSKSIGCASEIKIGPDSNQDGNRKPGLAVAMPVVTALSKSRSMGVLQSPRMVHCDKEEIVFQLVRNPQFKELDLPKLLVSVTTKEKVESEA